MSGLGAYNHMQRSILIFLVLCGLILGSHANDKYDTTSSPPAIDVSSTISTFLQVFQQLFHSFSKILKQILGFSSLVLRIAIPPTTPDLIRKHGYPVETHYVRTEDNVILELHRIPHGPALEFFRVIRRVPVILIHGIAQSSSDFLLNTPLKNSLGFFLSDEGFDVWLANLRGNINEKTKQGNFSWDYSFHEMGIYDMPAIIGYVSSYTGFNKVHIVGFSMGNTGLMTGLSKYPHLNSRVGVGVMMGPSVFHHNYYNGWLKVLTKPLVRPGQALQNQFGSVPVMHPWQASILHRILPIICHPRIDLVGICLAFTQIIFGYDRGQITKEKLALVTQVSPTPFSSKLLLHYMQHLSSGRFCEYDYGSDDKNLKVYGTIQPPEYNLTNVQAPMAIIVGPEDLLAHRKDALTLAKNLPNVVDFYLVPYQHFHHLDFCYAEDANILVYRHVVEILNRFS